VDDNGGNVIDMAQGKVSIREMVGGVPGRLPAQPPAAAFGLGVPEVPAREPEAGGLDMALPDALDPLPKASDPYQAHARVANKPLLTLSFLLKDGTTVRGFTYANFDSIDRLAGDAPGGGPVIVMRFAGLAPTEVRIEGRNLNTLYAYLSQHRIFWVRERGSGRDFLGESDPVVSGISITPLG